MKSITIIGGGLAGLTLGISLRELEVPVTVIEAGQYPRHRVCGEFISGAGLDVLRNLGLDKEPHLNARQAIDAAFFTSRKALFHRSLPSPAMCVSRYELDAALARRFVEAGGQLRTGERWQQLFGEGMVCATGRRAQPVTNGWRWFGLKVHARQMRLEADLEMHLSRDSYVGLCRLPNDEVNVCGLFRREVRAAGHGEFLGWLRGHPESRLFARLDKVEFDDRSFSAVAGLSLAPQRFDANECRLGDALTMIPPITGNGMSMAMESAQLAVVPLRKYSDGKLTWTEVTAQLTSALRGSFERRLRWAGIFHRVLFSRFGGVAARVFLAPKRVWRSAFELTR